MKPTPRQTELAINSLRNQLTQIRNESLRCSRSGDYMGVAKLTSRASMLNAQIAKLERQKMFDK